jgi:glucose-1-phosphate cytidylyltransferase
MAETGLHAMTGCRIKRIEKYIDGENFFLTYGDGLANLDLSDLWDYHLSHGKIGTVTAVAPPGRFGEMTLKGDRVAEFSEKPQRPNSRISGGFMAFQRHIFERLDDDLNLIFEQAPLMSLARDNQLMTFRHDGFWRCMDNSRDYQYLNELWDAGNPPWQFTDIPNLRAAA